eukprot:TRINITY_DN2424_c0_g1_i3.p1 TRINITY_DN2424_c0_g1~~TRINITY_DN2424_c0_g1_i3.p1  ORF type:complete len:178 (-),score=40.32 TRINITY_DN2424_c0_g1_i3:127-660(-)
MESKDSDAQRLRREVDMQMRWWRGFTRRYIDNRVRSSSDTTSTTTLRLARSKLRKRGPQNVKELSLLEIEQGLSFIKSELKKMVSTGLSFVEAELKKLLDSIETKYLLHSDVQEVFLHILPFFRVPRRKFFPWLSERHIPTGFCWDMIHEVDAIQEARKLHADMDPDRVGGMHSSFT